MQELHLKLMHHLFKEQAVVEVQQVDQVEEVQHPHHQQDLEPEVLEIHLQLVLHKEILAVEHWQLE